MTTLDATAPAQPQHHRIPSFGFTRLGHAVHARTFDHLPTSTAYARFNKYLAVWITNNVGTMSCFWIFCVIALLGLPAAMVEAHVISPTIGLIGEAGFVIMVQWVAQSFLQLVLLPSLMVGQNLQNEAADARAAKTFEDVEKIIDLLDCHTQGGLAEVLADIDALRQEVRSARAALGGAQAAGG
jgi:hypothetical protein